ncbi:MAG: hypothetical protein OEW70_03165 [candidate division WOR-3 bacterium]|nr:hypothetical protein [candidate division WOR-3 bacterium]
MVWSEVEKYNACLALFCGKVLGCQIKIEIFEAAAHKLLCELEVKTSWFSLYKDFTRKCSQLLKRYYGKEILNRKLAELIQGWVKEGLKEDVLLKLKDKIISVFFDLRLKGRV